MVRMQDRTEVQATNFNAIRISVASPEQIMNWSHGEVTKPETINYRTLRPEKDGLFCERLFGPTKDWECFCGKYKRMRYRGVVCDRCGVEVTRSKVRRERMGHIRLAAPVAHIWFSKTTPSRLGLLLDLSPRNLERVLYFAQHIITAVDDEKRRDFIEEENLKVELEAEKLQRSYAEKLAGLQAKLEALESSADPEVIPEAAAVQAEMDALNDKAEQEKSQLWAQLEEVKSELEDLRPLKILPDSKYRELKERFDDLFQARMGAEAILEILRTWDLEAVRDGLVKEMRSTSGQRRKKAIKRLQVVESFRHSGNRVEDIILTVLPVLPPELRPMVQLDGGRFATSDLNDLYRRVINRNNRLKRLMELGAPEIIIRNEKRMLQESVDALIDNGRRGRPIQGSHNHKLKSLSDLLRGKQGRFRQNLLGKRVDYSGRSVIVVGPELKMNQCGLPKRMALELFKPFVMHRLVLLGISPNIKSAKRMVERARPEVWDILEDVIKDRPVLLNRAPTLHRLGIQSFMPVLIEGNAIQIHPLVCSAFNADFDGDQMAVHVPLSREAVHEAQVAMLSTHNMLSPASGDPLVAPTLDIVMGCYYLTEIQPGAKGEGGHFTNPDAAHTAYADGEVDLRASIYVRDIPGCAGWVETSVGRLIFNEILPESLDFKNKQFNSREIKDLTGELHRDLGDTGTAEVLDNMKRLGFHYATLSGLTVAISDIQISSEKAQILKEADDRVAGYQEQYLSGLMSEDERYDSTIRTWTEASDEIEWLVSENLQNYGGIGVMAQSGTKGNIMQIKQMAGMRGLMAKPTRDAARSVIDLPIKSSFREGLTSLEYFISTHGARKGLTDTALNTANSGYMTRRLVDIAQEVIICEEDCDTYDAYWIEPRPSDDTGELDIKTLKERILGRLAAAPVIVPATGEILVDRNELVGTEAAQKIVALGITRVPVRSPLICEARRGVCRTCYGNLPATGQSVELGQAVGIIAAQSIGEPGTQLTMRTFHTGGVARLITVTSENDCRIEKIERQPDGQWVVTVVRAEMPKNDGVIEKIERRPDGQWVVMVVGEEQRYHLIRADANLQVREGQEVKERDILAIVQSEQRDYLIRADANLQVREGQEVKEREILAIVQLTGRVRGRGTDITSGLPRVEEIFEARVPKSSALLSEIDGEVTVDNDGSGLRIRVVSREEFREEYQVPRGVQLLVDEGDVVEPGMLIAATLPSLAYEADAGEEYDPDPIEEVVANVGGRVELAEDTIAIVWEDLEEREYPIPAFSELLVADGDQVKAGDRITDGPKNPHDILSIQGMGELQQYMVNEVQQVYRLQGVDIHDKHIEIILRQMLRRVQVKSIGDSDFIPDQVVDKVKFQENCAKVLAEGGEPATAEPVLLGVTRASLRTDSFLAAASFQETTRVLTQAAVSGAHDWLQGLKENVIIGRLIPAQVESTALSAAPAPETLPELGGLSEIGALVAAGWLETGEEAGGGAPAFGMGSEALTPAGFFLEEDPNSPGSSADEPAAGNVLTRNGEWGWEENGNESEGFSPGEDPAR